MKLRPFGKPSRRSMAVNPSAPTVTLPCRCGEIIERELKERKIAWPEAPRSNASA
jgi:hypothetical protein